jgi:DNA-binding NtrC family response regulator
MKSITIMIVEDNETMRLGMVESLRREHYTVQEYSNGREALVNLNTIRPQLIITDLKMEPIDGLMLLRQVKSLNSSIEVLMISAYGTIDIAVQAMQEGAVDFLTKPFSPEELRIRVKKIVEKIQEKEKRELLEEENQFLQDSINRSYEEIIGQSAEMKKVFSVIERVATQDSAVLIEGESGTGKELVARAIHRQSRRAGRPFIKVNCGALNENLLESELFGHEKGAFTGAIRQKRGRFELADGGTLFLDEIGDISLSMQVKLLRVLQEQEFERVGGEQTLKVDVRIISASNKNLPELLREGHFREDLYYRLSVIPIQLPPLRERKTDIPLLANFFLQKVMKNKTTAQKTIPAESLQLLSDYSWPGNIRELENLIERLVVISSTEEISPALVAQQLGKAAVPSPTQEEGTLDQALNSFEKNLILQALKQSGGIKNQAAKLLGIRTSTLYYKMEKYGIIK